MVVFLQGCSGFHVTGSRTPPPVAPVTAVPLPPAVDRPVPLPPAVTTVPPPPVAPAAQGRKINFRLLIKGIPDLNDMLEEHAATFFAGLQSSSVENLRYLYCACCLCAYSQK